VKGDADAAKTAMNKGMDWLKSKQKERIVVG